MDVVQIFEEIQRIRRNRDISHFGNDLFVGPYDVSVGGRKDERDSAMRGSNIIVWEGLWREVRHQCALGDRIRGGRGCPESLSG